MKKLNILGIATAATILFSASSVFAAEENKMENKMEYKTEEVQDALQDATTKFEKLAVESTKLDQNDKKNWEIIKGHLGVK